MIIINLDQINHLIIDNLYVFFIEAIYIIIKNQIKIK